MGNDIAYLPSSAASFVDFRFSPCYSGTIDTEDKRFYSHSGKTPGIGTHSPVSERALWLTRSCNTVLLTIVSFET